MLQQAQERRLAEPATVDEADRVTLYGEMADQAIAGEWPGSSAAGEQPKFTACVRRDGLPVSVIVKFSGSAGRPEDQRWADLLMAEHVAASLLNRHGIPAARTSIVRCGRAFLEVTRFDRTGAHGRRNIVSLSSLSAAFYGELMAPWTQIASTLEADGWITPEDARRMALLWWFGTLIGNTDMHYGNLSFYLTPGRPLRLAPAYDMLPMFYRPDLEGRLPDRQLSPAPPPPEQIDTWSRAIEIAIEFWRAVADEQEISREFRTIAGRSLEALAKQRRQFG